MTENERDTDKPRAWWPVLVYIGLMALGIPWYWPNENLTIVLGFPAWVIVAIAVSFAASVFTAWRLRTPWPGEAHEPEPRDDE